MVARQTVAKSSRGTRRFGPAIPAPMLGRVASYALLAQTFGPRGAGTLRSVVAAAVACMARRYNSKLVATPECPHCDCMVDVPGPWPPRWQRAPETLGHKLWECPAWQEVRGAVQPPDGDTEGTTGLVCHPRDEPGGRVVPALALQAQAPVPRQCGPQAVWEEQQGHAVVLGWGFSQTTADLRYTRAA